MAPLFFFVQFEFTHAIGPHAGRYIVAHPDSVDETGAAARTTELTRGQLLTGVTMKSSSADVLVVSVADAKARGWKVRRRTELAVEPPGAKEVPVLVATFIRATDPAPDGSAADAGLRRIDASEEAQDEFVAAGLRVLNTAIRAYRAGSRDPYVTEVTRRDARAVRIGYGTTADVAEGRWSAAILLPPPIGARASREERLAPSETTADVLSGRGEVLEGEDLLLRTYIDLDHGRLRAAALQARAAVHLLEIELSERAAIDLARTDFASLADIADGIIARVTTPGDEPTAAAEIESLVSSCERAVERWRYAGVEST